MLRFRVHVVLPLLPLYDFLAFWWGWVQHFYFYLKYLLFLQEDYRLLETMNRVTITKYSDMKQIAGNVARTMIDLNEKCKWHWSSNTLVMELQIPMSTDWLWFWVVFALPISTVCFLAVLPNVILQSQFLSSNWLPSLKSPHQYSVYILSYPSLYVTLCNPLGYVT